MALIIMPVAYSWRDAKGWIGVTRFHISCPDDDVTFQADVSGLAVALKNAVGGLTNAAFQSSNQVAFVGNNPTLTYGDNLEYPAEWMKAVFTFSTDDGNISRFKIPAPEIDLFDTDGVTILNDGSQAQVVAFVNAVKNPVGEAYVSTRSGVAYTHFEGGLLRLGKQPRRFNERIKSSHLIAGEGE